MEVVEVAHEGGTSTRRASPRRRATRRSRSSSSPTPSGASSRPPIWLLPPPTAAPCPSPTSTSRRSACSRHPATTAARWRSARDSRSATTRATAGRTTAFSPRARVRPPDARTDRRRDHRPRGRAGLRARPADPGAAHPPGEGDVQHHDEPDAPRARRPDHALLARAGRPSGAGETCTALTAYAKDGRPPARIRPPDVQGGRVPNADPGPGGRHPRASARGSIPATRSAATTPAWTTCCSWRSPRSGGRRTSTGWPTCWPRCADDPLRPCLREPCLRAWHLDMSPVAVVGREGCRRWN